MVLRNGVIVLAGKKKGREPVDPSAPPPKPPKFVRLPPSGQTAQRSLDEIFKLWQDNGRISTVKGKLDTPCIRWTGAVNNTGLPVTVMDGEPVMVHRFVYVRSRGKELNPSQVVKQTCGDKLCINPEHLKAIIPNSKQKTIPFRLTEGGWKRLEKYRPQEITWGNQEMWKAETVRRILAHGINLVVSARKNKDKQKIALHREYQPMPSSGVNYEVRVTEKVFERVRSLARKDESNAAALRRLLAIALDDLDKSEGEPEPE